ncbi:hypothetical protein [Malonomonas rubra]|uniref:hypothetical protein n=1 Tax=Malonomonas rubra TaxID=57040 RepID=UPI0026F00A12|nr:hypothetical protein [Malonomonas rubra]
MSVSVGWVVFIRSLARMAMKIEVIEFFQFEAIHRQACACHGSENRFGEDRIGDNAGTEDDAFLMVSTRTR